MKRSVSLILLTAVCALALAAVTTLSGCTVKQTGDDPTGSIDTPEPAPTGESAEYTSGYVDIALTIPEGWQWESVQDKELSTEGIRFWKTDDKALDFNLLCWCSGYGICGTGVTTEELTLSGGQQVWQYTGEASGSVWVDIAFVGTPGDYVCQPTGGTMDKATWDSCRDEVLAILGTAQFGRNAMAEQEAIDVAKTQYDGPYDETYGRYDIKTGVWSVTFVEGQRPTASIDIKPDGTAGPLALIDSAAK